MPGDDRDGRGVRGGAAEAPAGRADAAAVDVHRLGRIHR